MMNIGVLFCFYCKQRNSYVGMSKVSSILLMAVIFCLITVTTSSFALENNEKEVDGFVIAGSIDNQFSITVTNPGSKTSVENLSLSITNEPKWITNIRIQADNTGDLEPKTYREYTINFDVREDAIVGTIETVIFQVSADSDFIDYPNPEMIVKIERDIEEDIEDCIIDRERQEGDWTGPEQHFTHAFYDHTSGELVRLMIYSGPSDGSIFVTAPQSPKFPSHQSIPL